MALDTNLIQFLDKPSGVYRLTIDNSQVNTVGAATTIPLIIGFSKKGLFNTPVYCTDKDYFTSIFGDIDRTLERKGSWFHRTALELLTVSPVMVLNLYNLISEIPENIQSTELTDVNYDLTEFKSMSIGSTILNKDKKKDLYKHFYNTDKFWFPDGDKLNEFASVGNTDCLFQFVNIGQKPITVITRKSNVSGYKVSLNEWYGLDNVPEYLNGYDYIEDFFVDVIILSGDFTDYAKLSIDPIFGQYFNTTGFIKSKLDALLSLSQVTVLDIYTGCLIPDFLDKTGQVLHIVSLINQNTSRTGLLSAINEDVLNNEYVSGTKIDLVGHNLFGKFTNNVNDVDFLSYKGSILDANKLGGLNLTNFNSYFAPASSTVIGFPNKRGFTLTIPSSASNSIYSNLYNNVFNNKFGYGDSILVPLHDSGSHQEQITLIVDTAKIVGSDAIITFVPYDFTNTTIDASTVIFDTTVTTINSVGGIGFTPFNTVFQISNTGNTVIVSIPKIESDGQLSLIYQYAQLGMVAINDQFTGIILTDGTNSGTYTLHITNVIFDQNDNLVLTLDVPNYATNSLNPALVHLDTTQVTTITFDNISLVYNNDQTPFLNFNIITDSGITLSSNEIIIDRVTFGYNNNQSIQLDKYVVSSLDQSLHQSRLTRITKIEKINNVGWKIIAEGPIYNYNNNMVYTSGVDNHFDHYNGTSLFGFRIKDRMVPDNTNERMNQIYGVLTDTNIFATLIDKKAVTFRYVIDTFNHGLETGSKSILANLCKQRENAFGIFNAPSVKEFRESLDPLFTDLPTTSNPKPSFNMSYIPQGGNLQNNPSFRYTLPSELDGSAYCAFYMPNVLIRERGKTTSVPIAMYVAKNYILKYVNFKPWSIIAGNQRGIVSGTNVVGLDYQISDVERGYLEKFGINPIVLDKTDGLVITGNYTAKQNIKTSLSQINGTEVLIYIQDRVADVLKKYIWEFNTPELRLEIKTIVDGELEQIKIDGGIYDYENIMSSNNNTGETIDNLLGVLDSYIEVAKGLAKAIHRTTILKTGQISTGII